MNNQAKNKIGLFLVSLVVLVAFCYIFLFYAVAYEAKNGIVNTTSTTLNVRSGPGVTYSKVGSVAKGVTVIVIDETKDSSQKTWYKISFAEGSVQKQGFVSSDYIQISEKQSGDSHFEAMLSEENFPESYKEALRALHKKYPKWIFRALHTNMNWSSALDKQSTLGKNLVHYSSISSWKSLQDGAYQWSSGTWVGFDGSTWVAASKEIIAYYLDPRNFLTEDNIFQFISHAYQQSLQNVEGLSQLSKGTFLAGNFTENGKNLSYHEIIMDTAVQTGLNPYVIAAMICQEQGNNGLGKSISGKEKGYENLYNFFNIEAYPASGLTAVQRGLWYAGQSGNYFRPWNSRQASILGGASYYAKNYVKVGQDTLYLKKYNVQGNSPHQHQYMTNVAGAYGEAQRLSKAYTEGIRNYPLEFKIPVFKNMPASSAILPTGNTHPKSSLKNLEVEGQALSPSFSPATLRYELSVPLSVKKVRITASAYDSGAQVTGTGEITLSDTMTTVNIQVKSSLGAIENYQIQISKLDGSGTRKGLDCRKSEY